MQARDHGDAFAVRAGGRQAGQVREGGLSIFPIALVAIVEGFSTLAVEVIAIRLAIPVVGSSMTLTGVMLGVVLFALSAGYWRGGELSARWDNRRIRTAVARNLLLAGAIYAALSFRVEALLLEKTLDAGLSLGLGIGVAAAVLFVLPVYLASQTVPMLAELTNSEGKAGKASGKILFYSTLGSVAGGIVTPIYLFPNLGVRASTYVICAMLLAAALLISMKQARWLAMVVAAAVLLSHFLGKPRGERYSFDSSHQSIRIVEEKDDSGRMERVMYLNGGRASGVFVDNGESSFPYIREADRALAATRSEYVLAVGAAGFTFPRDASAMEFVKRVDAVDVDSAVRRIAEREFLLRPLPEKIRFLVLSARDALRQFRKEGRRYGFTLLDAYSGMGIPDELLTAEFFSDAGAVSEHVAANIQMDRNASSAFAKNVLASFQSALGRTWIKSVDVDDSDLTNMLVANWQIDGSAEWK
ncbi:MAG TPA: fused MFS/spermidine synthase, partial [Bryobacteraceae bacterium]|nr:fused MFS/spermidine synthase [Bryobacteraceae bacterium]